MINPEILEASEQIDLEYFLEREGVSYRATHGSSGAQFNLQTCPKCEGHGYKTFVNQETGFGNCFHGSCGAKFNKFTMIKTVTGLAGRQLDDYIKELAEEMGWRPRVKVSLAKESKQVDLVLPETYPIPFADGSNLTYLENRGITTEVCKRFGLRFAQKSWFNYMSEGERRGQLYENRVIIPVFDMDGKMVSFQGRDITGEAQRKYLFPPGFSSTGRYLYNANTWPKDGSVDTAIINEGVFDVIATDMALRTQRDLRNVLPVGTFGKHLSYGGEQSQLGELLRLKNERGLKRVVFMWDGEIAAIDAAFESAKLVSELGLMTSIAILPGGKDPNEVPASVVCNAYRSAVRATKSNALTVKMKVRKALA